MYLQSKTKRAHCSRFVCLISAIVRICFIQLLMTKIIIWLQSGAFFSFVKNHSHYSYDWKNREMKKRARKLMNRMWFPDNWKRNNICRLFCHKCIRDENSWTIWDWPGHKIKFIITLRCDAQHHLRLHCNITNTDHCSRCTEFHSNQCGICIVTKSVAFLKIILSTVRICKANPFHAKSIFRFLFSSSFIFDLFAFPQALKQTKNIHTRTIRTKCNTIEEKRTLHIVFNLFLVLSVVKCFKNS